MSGCRRALANGQWWGFCGETDMGQTAPALCTECGGDFILKDMSAYVKDGVNVERMQRTTAQLEELADIASDRNMVEAEEFLRNIIGARL